jgi:putative PIN family toxin of toxin-antitoxin system
MSAPSAVVDTNVFIAALWGSPTCQTLLIELEARAFELWISPPLLEELFTVIERKKFHHRISAGSIERLHHVLKRRAHLIHPTEAIAVMSDPSDNRVLECVTAASPSVLVTGDGAFLALKRFGQTRIISPATFLNELHR